MLMLITTACSTNEKEEVSSQSQSSQEKLIIAKINDRITIQKYELQTKKDIIATFNDPSVTEVFINAIKGSEKISGTANIAPPSYEVIIQKDGTESSYYLWININSQTSNAMYMNKGDTETAYKLSLEKTNSLKDIFKEIEK
jgi:hypothetical protein